MTRAIFLSLLILAAAGQAAAASDAGSVAGRVIITKALTKKRITMPAYNLRGVSLAEPKTAAKPDGMSGVDEFSRVVVYLVGPDLAAGKPVTVTLTQKDRRFDPEVVVIPVGSMVSFPNDDPIFHNVFSLSKVKSFDLGYYPKGQTRLVRFDKPGLVQVYCHLHADMSAAILVLDTDRWTRPGDGGTFSLQDIPPGNYEVVAWHRTAGFFRRQVTVRSHETVTINLTIPLQTEDSTLSAPGSGR
ncbi:MAG TPA: carboxypeptidase regulatory-like domain-containing protein [Terriglobia bacterium]|nr:carboxypeptidase regulatory-like domain-containing protein [Terriglobia bacterium]